MRRNRDARDRRDQESGNRPSADQLTPDDPDSGSPPAGEGGRLFGSVTSSDIANLPSTSRSASRSTAVHIALDEPLKELGVSDLAIRLHSRGHGDPPGGGRGEADGRPGPSRLSTFRPQAPLPPCEEGGRALVDKRTARMGPRGRAVEFRAPLSHPSCTIPRVCGRKKRIVHRKVTRFVPLTFHKGVGCHAHCRSFSPPIDHERGGPDWFNRSDDAGGPPSPPTVVDPPRGVGDGGGRPESRPHKPRGRGVAGSGR